MEREREEGEEKGWRKEGTATGPREDGRNEGEWGDGRHGNTTGTWGVKCRGEGEV